jgi:glycosidase
VFVAGGYAGYWPADFYQTNPAFGSSEQLQQLVADFRANNVLLLFDLVINHVGYGDYESYSPFNSSSDFHDCNGKRLSAAMADVCAVAACCG